jgi:hypothetical protein
MIFFIEHSLKYVCNTQPNFLIPLRTKAVLFTNILIHSKISFEASYDLTLSFLVIQNFPFANTSLQPVVSQNFFPNI